MADLNRTYNVFKLLFLLTILLSNPTQAASKINADNTVKLISEFGVNFARILLRESRVKLPKSTLPIEQQNKLLNQLLEDYEKKNNSFYASKNAASDLDTYTKTFFGASTLTGVGIVPAIIGISLSNIATEKIKKTIDKIALKNSRVYWTINYKKILAETGLSYEQQRKDPEKLKEAINKSGVLLKDFGARLKGDVAGKEVLLNILVDGWVNTEKKTLDIVATQGQKIESTTKNLTKLSIEVSNFEKETKKTFLAHKKNLILLGNSVERLGSAVKTLGNRLSDQENNQNFIVDFVLDEMSPKQKVQALKDGFLSERFKCKNGLINCEAKKIKLELIERYEAEKNVEEFSLKVINFSAKLNDISSIAQNLGINDPNLYKAIKLSSVAANISLQIASNNYLGAFASATSLLGKQKDPNAERFKLLMSYLERRFDRIDLKLDKIIANQKVILNSMIAISEKMDEQYKSQFQFLEKFEYEQKTISDATKTILWSDWKSCFTVYQEALRPERHYVDSKTYEFFSVNDMDRLLKLTGISFRPCLRVAQESAVSLSGTQWFGNYLDSRFALNQKDAFEVLPEIDKERYITRPVMQRYEIEIHKPAYQILSNYLKLRSISWSDMFSALISPSITFNGLDEEMLKSTGNTYSCYDKNVVHPRLNILLCNSSNRPDEQVRRLMEKPIIADTAIHLADWMLVVSQLADIYNNKNQQWLNSDEIIERLNDEIKFTSSGRDLLERNILVLDTVIASYGMMYGGIVSKASFKLLEDPTVDQNFKHIVIRFLDQNPYAGSNFANYFLRQRYSKKYQSGEGFNDGILPKETYADTIERLRTGETEAVFFLNGLFGDDILFDIDKNGSVYLTYQSGEKDLRLKLPHPNYYSRGIINYPEKFHELIGKRRTLFERLYQYDVLDSINDINLKGEVGMSLLH